MGHNVDLFISGIDSQLMKAGWHTDPSVEGLEWEPYDEKSRVSMVISQKPHLKLDVLREQRKLLSPLLRYMINPSYTALSYNVPVVRKVFAGGAAIIAGIAGAAVLISHLIKK